MLAVLWLAELTGRAYVDGLVVLLLDVVLVWAVLWGAAGRPGAIIGGAAMLGLLLVAPVARALPGPARGIPPEWQGVALVLLQLLFVGGVARTAALWESALDAAVVAGGALVLLTVLARLIVGGRQLVKRLVDLFLGGVLLVLTPHSPLPSPSSRESWTDPRRCFGRCAADAADAPL